MRNIEIPNGVTSIGDSAFGGCSSLKSIDIPDSVESIGDGFYGCKGMKSIKVGANNPNYKSEKECLIEKKSNALILGCKNSVIPEYVTSIGDNAFSGCSGLGSIEIPSSVTSICDMAFYGCNSLTSIVIPSSVTNIGEWAFYGCISLKSIVVPSSVANIGKSAFSCCDNLTIYCEADSQPSGWDKDWNPNNREVLWGNNRK